MLRAKDGTVFLSGRKGVTGPGITCIFCRKDTRQPLAEGDWYAVCRPCAVLHKDWIEKKESPASVRR